MSADDAETVAVRPPAVIDESSPTRSVIRPAVVAGLGVPGAWLAAVTDINTRALLMFRRFRQGRWKRMKV
jgi:Na+-driven multidrug efflux pump